MNVLLSLLALVLLHLPSPAVMTPSVTPTVTSSAVTQRITWPPIGWGQPGK